MSLLLTGIGILSLSATVADADLWGHVRFGQDILQARALTSHDPYSYLTTGSAWVNHEWLSEVIFAATYHWSGPTGLIALKTFIGVLLVTASYRYLRRHDVKIVSAGILVLLVLLALRPGLGTIRPQLFTYLCFFAVLLAIERSEEGGDRTLGVLPLVFAAWVNLHGGFLAGLAVLAVWGGVRVALLVRIASGRVGTAFRDPRILAVVCAVLASAVATILNPYGIGLIRFLLATATVPRPEITEWQPVQVASQFGAVYLALLGIAVAATVFGQKARTPGRLTVLALMALTPVVAVRHLPLFALTVVVVGGAMLADAVRSGVERTTSESGPASAVMAVVAVVSLTMALPNFRCIQIDSGSAFPAGATALLKQVGAEGSLATVFNWGEFLIWHLGPGIQVSFDGRRETVYPDDVRREALNFMQGTGDWGAVLRRPQADMALVPAGSAPDNLLRLDRNWTLVYQDRVSRLFAREGSSSRGRFPGSAPIGVPVDGDGTCFPMAELSRR